MVPGMKKKRSKAVFVNLILAGIIAGLYFALILPFSTESMSVSGFPVYKGSNKDTVALQCTVTWDAGAMDDILATLMERNVNITFAVSGEWAERNPEMLCHMAELGHEIVTMGYSPQEDGKLAFVKADIEKSVEIIESIIGIKPSLYYCGSRNSSISTVAANKLSLKPVMCTTDLICANGDYKDIIDRVSANNTNVNGGDILLVSPTAAFSKALPYILDYFENRGLTTETVSGTIYS